MLAQRVEIERVAAQVARSTPFVAFRSSTEGFIARSGASIELARVLIAGTQLGEDAALVSTLETRGAATSWLTCSPPPFPTWAARTCAATIDEGATIVDEDTDPFPVFALLRECGGQLVA